MYECMRVCMYGSIHACLYAAAAPTADENPDLRVARVGFCICGFGDF